MEETEKTIRPEGAEEAERDSEGRGAIISDQCTDEYLYLKLSQNPGYYNLPADYGTLTDEEQRKARLWGLYNWTHSNEESFMAAFRLWHTYYMAGWIGNLHIYPHAHVEWHERAVRMAVHRNAAIMAYRGFAKTTFITQELVAFEVLTKHKYPAAIIPKTEKIGKTIMNFYITQYTQNERLCEDLGYSIRPFRGRFNVQAIWIQEIAVATPNGSTRAMGGGWILNSAWRSGIRGMNPRPLRLVLDDPEDDRKMRNPDLIEQFETQFIREVLPAVAADALRLGRVSRVIWPGTFIDVAAPSVLRKIVEKLDPRYADWRTLSIPVYHEHRGRKKYAWPGPHGRKFCERMLKLMGPVSFEAEFLGVSPLRTARIFRYDAARDGFRLTTAAGRRMVYPTYGSDEHVEADTHFSPMLRYVMVDPALGEAADGSDTAILAVAVDYRGRMWVLGGYSEPLTPEMTMPPAINLAKEIKAHAIIIEDWAFQRFFVSQLSNMVASMVESWPGGSRPPTIRGFHSAIPDKPSRISYTLQYPVNTGAVRMPHASNAVYGDEQAVAQLRKLIDTWTLHGITKKTTIDILDARALIMEAAGSRKPPPPRTADVTKDRADEARRQAQYKRLLARAAPSMNADTGRYVMPPRRKARIRVSSMSSIRKAMAAQGLLPPPRKKRG